MEHHKTVVLQITFPHQIKEKLNNVRLSRLCREKQRGDPILAGGKRTRPGRTQGLANLQEPPVGGVVKGAVARTEFRDVNSVGEVGIIL